MTREAEIKTSMDRIYRHTRHVYDASRKYFLLGRDTLIQNLHADESEDICEIGCGTARNLMKLSENYPKAHFYGIDASDEMLKTARKNLHKTHSGQKIKVSHGYAQSFNPDTLFGIDKFDKCIFSYSLSMIPPWKEAIDHALHITKKGGEIHIVDFGQQHGLPKIFKRFLFWFLALFHVHPEKELIHYLEQLQMRGEVELTLNHLYKGYAFLAVLKKPGY